MPSEWPTLQRPPGTAQHLLSGPLGRGVCLPSGPLGWGVCVGVGESLPRPLHPWRVFFGTRRGCPGGRDSRTSVVKRGAGDTYGFASEWE